MIGMHGGVLGEDLLGALCPEMNPGLDEMPRLGIMMQVQIKAVFTRVISLVRKEPLLQIRVSTPRGVGEFARHTTLAALD